MQRTLRLCILLCFLAAATGAAQAQTFISEFQPNPPGTDPAQQSFELFGTPGASFSGVLVSIESDVNDPGDVNSFASVSGTFDANGLLVVSLDNLENPSFTVILTESFTGNADTDIDTDDDGVADDLSAFGPVIDAIGVPDSADDEELIYGSGVGGTDFAFTGAEPELIFRSGSDGDLYAINDLDAPNAQAYDVSARAIPVSEFSSDPTQTTFGAVNPTRTVAAAPSVAFSDQTSGGRLVVVQEVTVPDGGFIAIHNDQLLAEPPVVQGSVIGVSAYLAPGTYTDVPVRLFEVPGLDVPADTVLTMDQTLIAMPHRDTNDNETYDFLTSNGSEDGAYTDGGNVVVGPAAITVDYSTVVFDDQVSADGTTVTVASAYLPDDGFIAIHNDELLAGEVQGSVIGVSAYLEAGTYTDVPVTLFDVPGLNVPADTSLMMDQTLIAMPHMDTNDNEVYNFLTSGGAEDGAFFAYEESAADEFFVVLDPAAIQVPTRVSFAADVANVQEGDPETDPQPTFEVIVQLENPSPDSATVVRLTIENEGTATPDTADATDPDYEVAPDFDYPSMLLTFAPGESGPKTFTFDIIPDGIQESDESIIFSLTSEPQDMDDRQSVAVMPFDQYLVTILDDDSPAVDLPNAWINEINYDTPGSDVGEFVEIAVDMSDVDLSRLAVQLYDGNGAVVYETTPLAEFTGGEVTANGFQLFSYSGYGSDGVANIQNGPDGIALCFDMDGDGDYDGDDTIVASGGIAQFLGYETDGSITPSEGCAAGQQSIDIGLADTSDEPDLALALTGSDPDDADPETGLNDDYSDFGWALLAPSPGEANPSQNIPVELVSFESELSGEAVLLSWTTASEENNAGFHVQMKQGEQPFQELAFVEGAGTTTEAQRYAHSVSGLAPGTYTFRLRQVDADGTDSFSEEIEVDVTMTAAFRIEAPAPNPATSRARMHVAVREAQAVRVELYDALGRLVATPFDGEMAAESAERVEVDAASLPSGVYVYRVVGEGFSENGRLVIVR